MSRFVHGVDPATIGTVIEANINAHLLSFARLPGAQLHDDTDVVWVDSGVPDATFNAVVRASFHPQTADSQIESVLSHFRRRSLPVTWHVGPSSRPSDLGRLLLAHGLTHSEDEPGMAIEVDRMHDDFRTPPELTIETVRDDHRLREWVAVWLFPLPEEVRQRCLDVLRGKGLGDDLPWRYYLARLEGKPVAISELFIAEGVVGVQYVVTLPEVRRRGIGTAMTLHVLHEGRGMGYRVGVLTASPDGIEIYRRIGFREYCWIHRYELG